MGGVVGILGHPESANLAYLGLFSLQHRGRMSAGIVAADGEHLRLVRSLGQVADIFTAGRLADLSGGAAIGHVRDSESEHSAEENAEPITMDYSDGSLAVAHDGNLLNANELRDRLGAEGAVFQTSSDAEVIVHLIARSPERALPDRIADALRQVRGAYSMAFLSEERLIVVRDPMGFRPLALGRIGAGVHVVSSETCTFGLIGADFVRQLEPGEMLIIEKNTLRSMRPFSNSPTHRCSAEWVYSARSDSEIDGRSVYAARESMGQRLAIEHPASADVVVPVLDVGVAAAIGYAQESGIPYRHGFTRSAFGGRTVIEPSQQLRHFGVKLKLAPVRGVVAARRVVLVDHSIFRGTTIRKLVAMIREAGAREVHVRISSPMTVGACCYGTSTPTRDELIAASHTPEEILTFIGADSLGYLSIEGLEVAMKGTLTGRRRGTGGFCDACFSNRYPIASEGRTRPRLLRLVGDSQD